MKKERFDVQEVGGNFHVLIQKTLEEALSLARNQFVLV